MGGSTMNTHRRTAMIVGVLFIVALVPFLVGQALYEPILGSSDYLDHAYQNRVIVIIGVLLEFLSALAVVLIPVLLFPILRIHNLVLALGYVSFRLFETVLLSIAQVYKLSLVNLSQDYLNRGGLEASYFQIVGNSMQSVIYWVDHAGAIYLVVFVMGALMLNSALYRSRLIPRWLSIWGIIAAVAVLIASLLATLDIALLLAGLLVIPIGLQEQVMALWLIFKGFNPTALASEPA
jgi:hypothetical protein